MSKLICVKCKEPAHGGGLGVIRGSGTGHNAERFLLCHDCLGLLRGFLLAEPVHVQAGDPVCAAGLAHIATCPSCNARFGGAPPAYRVIEKADVAERFLRDGHAQ